MARSAVPAYPREIPAPEGLPPGWCCIEHVSLSGKSKGKTYKRFRSPTARKDACSVKQAVARHASQLGLGADSAFKVFDCPRARRLSGGQLSIQKPQDVRLNCSDAFPPEAAAETATTTVRVENAAPTFAPNTVAVDRQGEDGRLPSIDGSFDWIHLGDGRCDFALRRKAAGQTREACLQGGYVISGNPVPLRRIPDMLRGTRLVRSRDAMARCASAPSKDRSYHNLRWSEHSSGRPLAVAVAQARAGVRVVLVVPSASAYDLGGNFVSGGPHGLEESVLTQTTQYMSLTTAEAQATQQGVEAPRARPPAAPDGRAWQCHIPEDAAVLSPGVEVFRGDADEGYQFLHQPVCLSGVASLAMPNRSGHSRAAEPVDAPLLRDEYVALLRVKFAAAIAAAVLVGATCLVATDLDCCKSGCNARDVGDALRAALVDIGSSTFREVCLVGSETFAAAAQGLLAATRAAACPVRPAVATASAPIAASLARQPGPAAHRPALVTSLDANAAEPDVAIPPRGATLLRFDSSLGFPGEGPALGRLPGTPLGGERTLVASLVANVAEPDVVTPPRGATPLRTVSPLCASAEKMPMCGAKLLAPDPEPAECAQRFGASAASLFLEKLWELEEMDTLSSPAKSRGPGSAEILARGAS